MGSITDPARELAELCEKLRRPNIETRGEDVLATAFEVEKWSTEFYQIIFTISKRADQLSELVPLTNMDDDLKSAALKHIGQVKLAFGRAALHNPWKSASASHISPEHVGPIKMLSPQIRPLQCYNKLNETELNELLDLTGDLLDWLRAFQLVDQDFIRQLIIEGLEQMRFRLERIEWLGWGYTMEALREVIGAYLALERGMQSPATSPDAEAVLRKTAALIKAVYEKARTAKDVAETGDFVLKAYGAATIFGQSVKGVAGLIGLQA